MYIYYENGINDGGHRALLCSVSMAVLATIRPARFLLGAQIVQKGNDNFSKKVISSIKILKRNEDYETN
jgi:hypothetical protein